MEAPEPRREEIGSLAQVLAAPGSREWHLLTDRLAYVRAIGGYPSHLGVRMTRLVTAATVLARGAGLDRCGSIMVRDEVARALGLDGHPMMVTALRMMVRGFTLVRPGFPHSMRRPCDRILMMRADGVAIYVRIDGSIIGPVLD